MSFLKINDLRFNTNKKINKVLKDLSLSDIIIVVLKLHEIF